MEIASQAVQHRRKDYHTLSWDGDDAENATEELGCIRALVGDTAAATSALSRGPNDRENNELQCLEEGLRLVDCLLCREARDDFEFCHGGELALSMTQEEVSVNEVEAVKWKESDEHGEKVVAVEGGVVAKVTVHVVQELEVKGLRDLCEWCEGVEGCVFRVLLVCCAVELNTWRDNGG